MRQDIAVGDRLITDAQSLNFEKRRGPIIDFLDARTQERLSLTDLELATRIADGQAKLVCRGGTVDGGRSAISRAADFSALPIHVREMAKYRLAYAEAAGSLPPPLSEKMLRQVIQETARRSEDPKPPSSRQVRRYLKRGGPKPVASMFVSRDARKGNRRDRLDLSVREIVERRIDKDYMSQECITVVQLTKLIAGEVGRLNEHGNHNLALPSQVTVSRAITARNPYDVLAARKGKAAANRRYAGAQTRKDPARPFEVVELDHTLCDLFVICEMTGLPIGRPTIVIAIDRASRYPLGLHVGFDPPSVHTVMQCFRNMILPKTYLAQKVERGEWKVKHVWHAFGKPKRLVIDRALENIGGDLEDFAAEIGFHYTVLGGRDPKKKGAIERFLGTLNRTMLQQQRGTTFSNVMDRGDYDPAKNAVITHAELLYVLHRELLDVYACVPHRGLRDVPEKKFLELVENFPVEPIQDVQHLNMLFGHVSFRKLTRKGIEFENLAYYSPEIVELLANPEFPKRCASGVVRFRYDPADLRELRVHDPVNDRMIVVPPCERDAEYVTGLSLWQHRLIVKVRNARMRENADYEGLAQAKLEIHEYFAQAWSRRGQIRSRRTAARHAGIGRVAMAGTSEATSPVGSDDQRSRENDASPDTVRQEGRGQRRRSTQAVSSSCGKTRQPARSQPGDVDDGRLASDEEDDLYAARGIARSR